MIRKSIQYDRKPVPDIEKPYGYIYIIRNLVTMRPYIGQKASPVVVDSYWGSSEDLSIDIETLGVQNFSREILDWAKDKNELNQKERYWIDKINTFHGFGYNRSCGGDGLGSGIDHPCYGRHYNLGKNNPFYGVGLQHTVESRAKMSDIKKGCIGEKNNFYGKHHTEEWKQKYRNGANNPVAKKVYQYDLSGNLVKVFDYLKEVTHYGYSEYAVSNRCTGRCKNNQYLGYIWSYTPLQEPD